VRAAIDDPTTGDEVKADHDAVIALGGWGVPTLVFDDGQALFGPVLIDPPTGDAAVRLWHALTAWLEFIAGGDPPKSDGAEGLEVVRRIAELRTLAGLDSISS